MERDFLGLNSSQQQSVLVKEELFDGTKVSGFSTKGSGNPWQYMNKLPGLLHQPKRVAAADSFNKKCPVNEFQRTFNHDRPLGGNFPMVTYAAQAEAHNIHLQHILPNSSISLSMNNHFFKTHFAGLAESLGSANAKQPIFGGISVTASQPTLPSAGSNAGFTEHRNNAKASVSPAQLTIFYGGSVNVYDEISPEKAQAIMLLAGTGSSMASKANSQRSQVQPLLENGGVTLSQPVTTPPNSAISSPISVSSHGNNNELLQAQKMAGVSVMPNPKTDAPKIVNSVRPVISSSNMIQSDVPQARKASLARFLEKRKERVMTASAPYDLIKKSPEFAT